MQRRTETEQHTSPDRQDAGKRQQAPIHQRHGECLQSDGHDPLEVIKWRDIYRELENAIDAAEDAAEAMERMLAKGA